MKSQVNAFNDHFRFWQSIDLILRLGIVREMESVVYEFQFVGSAREVF